MKQFVMGKKFMSMIGIHFCEVFAALKDSRR